jgi:hypothetical protein
LKTGEGAKKLRFAVRKAFRQRCTTRGRSAVSKYITGK